MELEIMVILLLEVHQMELEIMVIHLQEPKTLAQECQQVLHLEVHRHLFKEVNLHKEVHHQTAEEILVHQEDLDNIYNDS